MPCYENEHELKIEEECNGSEVGAEKGDGRERDEEAKNSDKDEYDLEDSLEDSSSSDDNKPLAKTAAKKVLATQISIETTKKHCRRNPSCFKGEPYTYLAGYKNDYNKIQKKGTGRN